MDNSSIKKNIGDLRRGRKITQEDLAQKTGMSRNSLREIEVGETKLISEKLGDIAAALGVSTERIVLGYDPEDAPGTLADVRQSYEDQLREAREEIAHLKEEVHNRNRFIQTLEDLNASLKDNIVFLREKLNQAREEK